MRYLKVHREPLSLCAILQWFYARGWENGTTASADDPRRNVPRPRHHIRISRLALSTFSNAHEGLIQRMRIANFTSRSHLQRKRDGVTNFRDDFRRVKRRWKMEMHLGLRSDFRSSWFCLLIRIEAKTASGSLFGYVRFISSFILST